MASTQNPQDTAGSPSSVPVEANETSPLLPKPDPKTRKWSKSVIYRVLLTSFLVSLTFGITQVPLIYIFGLMTCDEYYKTHPEPGPGINRCKVPAIEAGTAEAVALVGASTTLFGVINLFVTGWTIKAFGIKQALLISIFWPSVRLLVQNIGVELGAGLGILTIQLSQIMTIVGGPAGYLLALNSFATEIVEPVERTAALGRLQGCAMFGTAVGFLAGGILGDVFDIATPFRVTLAAFLLCTIYGVIFLPTIPLNKNVEAKSSKSLSAFIDPIKMFLPQKWVLRSGKVQREYGILLLGIGIFVGVLATSYIPVLLQMYATDVFGFGTLENGWLISINCVIRGLFLTFAFPPIISHGRKWLDARNASKERLGSKGVPTVIEEPIPDASLVVDSESQPPKPTEEKQTFAFDLFFTRYSLILDGVLTGLATFTSEGWQMYIIAVILPLASGTGSSAKGTILQMCTPEQRTDALSAISLVEMIARLSTTAIFGLVFAGFASIGKTHLTFACNAAIALIGFVVLVFARFPPDGSRRFIDGAPSTTAEEEEDS